MKFCLIFLILVVLSAGSNAATDCITSQAETDFVTAMNKVTAIPVWGKFPTNTAYAVDDLDTSSPGYYIVPHKEEAQRLVDLKIAEICSNQPLLVRFLPSREELNRNFYNACSSVPNDDACRGAIKSYYEVTQKSIGSEVIDRKRISGLFNDFKFKHRLNYVQFGIYNSSHETFHSYQEDINGFTNKLSDEDQAFMETYAECLTSNTWSNQYKKERKWWKNNLSTLFDKASDLEILKKIAQKFIINLRPMNPSNKRCNKSLNTFELLEGVPHFIGNSALLRSKLITPQELAEFDTQYFDLSPELHDIAYVYGSGGAVSMLLERLMGSAWHLPAEEGISPYDILKEYVQKNTSED